jgi:hypothetical protein
VEREVFKASILIAKKFDQSLVYVFEWSGIIDCLCWLFVNCCGISWEKIVGFACRMRL